MEITCLGHACFRIKGSDATIVTDPYNESVGYTLGMPTADIVTVSHSHGDHSYVQGVSGSPQVVEGPGEFQIAGVRFTGISTFHDDEGGAKRGQNTVYVIEIDGLKVCHLGDLGHIPTAQQIEQLNGVDVLM
ncbi:MAG: MBL fold metallo-hydrolase, partial [Dehalococcoidia bacterium]|nr:MBL fold metallo-hydrolase [Dehalococcoidia bacterium]